MLGLDFAQAGSARNGSESGACSWGRSRKPSKTVNVPPHHSSTETAEPSFGNRRLCVRRGGQNYWLPFGRLWYGEPGAISNAVGYALFYSRSHDAVIRVYDEPGNVIETHEHACEFKEC
jgi:hypothetical protein